MIEGFKKFAYQVDDLARNIETKIMRAALTSGANVFRREIRKEIRTLPISKEGKRALSRGLFIHRHRPRHGRVTVSVRFRASRPSKAELQDKENSKPSDPFWWHFLERGTQDRKTRRGAFRGRMRATPFVEPAVRRAEQAAYTAILDKIDEEVEKAIRRTGIGP